MITGTFGKSNSHFGSNQTGSGTHHDVKAAVDWCRLLYCHRLELEQFFISGNE